MCCSIYLWWPILSFIHSSMTDWLWHPRILLGVRDTETNKKSLPDRSSQQLVLSTKGKRYLYNREIWQTPLIKCVHLASPAVNTLTTAAMPWARVLIRPHVLRSVLAESGTIRQIQTVEHLQNWTWTLQKCQCKRENKQTRNKNSTWHLNAVCDLSLIPGF